VVSPQSRHSPATYGRPARSSSCPQRRIHGGARCRVCRQRGDQHCHLAACVCVQRRSRAVGVDPREPELCRW
jgi:hypothetical protein